MKCISDASVTHFIKNMGNAAIIENMTFNKCSYLLNEMIYIKRSDIEKREW